jgi:hypothetical protein
VPHLHTFGEYLDFHPHIHALVADGLFTQDGQIHPVFGASEKRAAKRLLVRELRER